MEKSEEGCVVNEKTAVFEAHKMREISTYAREDYRKKKTTTYILGQKTCKIDAKQSTNYLYRFTMMIANLQNEECNRRRRTRIKM